MTYQSKALLLLYHTITLTHTLTHTHTHSLPDIITEKRVPSHEEPKQYQVVLTLDPAVCPTPAACGPCLQQ